MNQRIREYVEQLFENAPRTHRIFELKEELIHNLNERYNDLLATGKTEEEAFTHVRSSIGDINELISGVEESATIDQTEINMWRKKTAKVVSISVAMYIASIAIVLIFELIPAMEAFGPIGMFLMIAAATGMLVYHFMSMPKYIRMDSTVVEEFKEWQDKKSKNKEVEEAISSILWIATTALYLIISFTLNLWGTAWIIFVVSAAVQCIINLLFKLKRY